MIYALHTCLMIFYFYTLFEATTFNCERPSNVIHINGRKPRMVRNSRSTSSESWNVDSNVYV
jgi:hypothetical protein